VEANNDLAVAKSLLWLANDLFVEAINAFKFKILFSNWFFLVNKLLLSVIKSYLSFFQSPTALASTYPSVSLLSTIAALNLANNLITLLI